MLSIIKTAIITIVISFISGVLLDTYKNLAPRIVCSIGKGIPIRLGNKKIRAYTLTVRNISNKTIHDLTLNIQGHYDNLKVDDAKITRGLKFDDSNEDNIYCVNIPFLSKDDEFSVKLFVEKIQGTYKKPVVTLRSPENFKKIESEDQNGFMASLLNVPENIGYIFKKSSKDTNSNNKGESSFNNKKVVATIVSIILIIFVAVFGIQYYFDKTKTVNNEVKTNSSQKLENSSNPSTSSSKNNATNKQATEKNNNSTSSEGKKSNTSSEAKSSTPSSSKSNQSVEKTKSESDESTSDSKSQTNSSEEETKNKSTDSTSVDSGESKDETKSSSESKTKGTTESKTQEEKSSNNESGESGTTSPSESKTN